MSLILIINGLKYLHLNEQHKLRIAISILIIQKFISTSFQFEAMRRMCQSISLINRMTNSNMSSDNHLHHSIQQHTNPRCSAHIHCWANIYILVGFNCFRRFWWKPLGFSTWLNAFLTFFTHLREWEHSATPWYSVLPGWARVYGL